MPQNYVQHSPTGSKDTGLRNFGPKKHCSTKNPLLLTGKPKFYLSLLFLCRLSENSEILGKIEPTSKPITGMPLKNCVLVCKIHILVVHSTKFWLEDLSTPNTRACQVSTL